MTTIPNLDEKYKNIALGILENLKAENITAKEAKKVLDIANYELDSQVKKKFDELQLEFLETIF